MFRTNLRHIESFAPTWKQLPPSLMLLWGNYMEHLQLESCSPDVRRELFNSLLMTRSRKEGELLQTENNTAASGHFYVSVQRGKWEFPLVLGVCWSTSWWKPALVEKQRGASQAFPRSSRDEQIPVPERPAERFTNMEGAQTNMEKLPHWRHVGGDVLQ